MATFNDFWDTLKTAVEDFAETSFNNLKDQAIKDGQAFLDKTKDDIKQWTQELADGTLSEDDFRFLLLGKKDLAELEALKEAGLAAAETDKFISGLINTVVSTAVKIFI